MGYIVVARSNHIHDFIASGFYYVEKPTLTYMLEMLIRYPVKCVETEKLVTTLTGSDKCIDNVPDEPALVFIVDYDTEYNSLIDAFNAYSSGRFKILSFTPYKK